MATSTPLLSSIHITSLGNQLAVKGHWAPVFVPTAAAYRGLGLATRLTPRTHCHYIGSTAFRISGEWYNGTASNRARSTAAIGQTLNLQ